MKELDRYIVTIRIETPAGYAITVKMEDCPRDALLTMPNIAPALRMLEQSIPGDAE